MSVFKPKPLKKLARVRKLEKSIKVLKRKIKINKQMQKNKSRLYSA